jgi:hypothetical protein
LKASRAANNRAIGLQKQGQYEAAEKEFRNAISDEAAPAGTTTLAPGEIDPGATVTVESSASTAEALASPTPPVAAGESTSS